MKTRLLLALALAVPAAAFAGKAHQHGVAKLDIGADPGKLVIAFETPLDNLLGFERAPRTDAERKQAADAIAKLKDGAALFRIDPAAACTLASVELNSAPLKLGAGTAAGKDDGKDDGHGDLDAEYSFNCTGAPAGHVEIALFDAFPRLQRLRVQAATAKGQASQTLKRPAKRIELRR
jgi:hypothetical protein